MSTASQPTPTPAAPPTGSPATDERLVPISRVTRLMRRPELGALMGAIAVWILFAITDASSNHLWLNQTGLAAWTQQAAFFGIIAVPVGLLMIGGEFDLSTGVMSGVTAIVPALLVGKYHWDTLLAIVATVVFAAAVGLLNGYVVVKSKLPSFIVTLATFFILRGASVGGVLLLNHGSTNVTVSTPPPAGLS
ncbi:MAG: ABC transporter permease, partial [Solirubrobacteraceae bacterium]